MDRVGLVALAAIASALAHPTARAEPRGEEACHQFLQTVNALCAEKDKASSSSPMLELCEAGPQTGGCSNLASLLEAVVNDMAGGWQAEPDKDRAPSQAQAKADIVQQPDRRTATNKSGSVAAIEPVASAQPINLAGGSLSLAGTRTGTQGVATVTVNPLALGGSTDARASRMVDLSVTAPFRLDGSSEDSLRFVAIRLRANLAALWSTDKLRRKLDGFYSEAGKFADALGVVLRSAPDVAGCAESVLRQQKVTAQHCGQTLEQAKMERLRGESYQALAAARRQADSHYLGLDLRVDMGDPTGIATPGDDGTRIQGGLAFGIRIPQGDRWDFELRGHAGGDYFHSKQIVDGLRMSPVFSFDWGVAALLSGNATHSTEKQRMAFGVGLVGRQTKDSSKADLVPTNFVDLRLMVIVPTTSGSDLGLAFTVPVNESAVSRGTIVTFSTDIGLLDGTHAAAASSGNRGD